MHGTGSNNQNNRFSICKASNLIAENNAVGYNNRHRRILRIGLHLQKFLSSQTFERR